jgi:hypothetical protein
MPYTIGKRGSQWGIIKISDGTIIGCHDTLLEAQAQRDALEANERNKRTQHAIIHLDLDEIEQRIKRLEQHQ